MNIKRSGCCDAAQSAELILRARAADVCQSIGVALSELRDGLDKLGGLQSKLFGPENSEPDEKSPWSPLDADSPAEDIIICAQEGLVRAHATIRQLHAQIESISNRI